MKVSIIRELIRNKALFVINHSGGKDSHAMSLRLKRIIPAAQLLIVHAHLPEVEWEGTEDFIRETLPGIPLVIANAVKTFFAMVLHRMMWPSPEYRQCTSDLKRGPIDREIRKYAKAHGFSIIVSCQGMRAEESSKRKKLNVFKYDQDNSIAGRTWYDWLCIHSKSTEYIFETIRKENQRPFWVYEEGMTRKSCCFCIMSSMPDIKTAARLRRELLLKYAAVERYIDKTLLMPVNGKRVFLDEMFDIKDDERLVIKLGPRKGLYHDYEFIKAA